VFLVRYELDVCMCVCVCVCMNFYVIAIRRTLSRETMPRRHEYDWTRSFIFSLNPLKPIGPYMYYII
jgi:hypothetical protein